MSEVALHVAIIVGSTREGRFGGTVAEWFVEHARRRRDMVLDVIDLVDNPMPWELSMTPTAEISSFRSRIGTADAFVVITPEYNHSFPSALKSAIDNVREEWEAKPVAFVSYGGVSGGLRAVEHLRQVFGELHAVAIRDSVSFHSAWDQFDDTGAAVDAVGCGGAAKTMLDRLAWWALALRTAREAVPYES
jgi:NAD(P)H-dependent FMN reductase